MSVHGELPEGGGLYELLSASHSATFRPRVYCSGGCKDAEKGSPGQALPALASGGTC